MTLRAWAIVPVVLFLLSGCEKEGYDRCPEDREKDSPGTCGCGISDADTSRNGVPDCLDSKIDYCPDDSAKALPGVCGCGVSDADANENGVSDCLDGTFDLCPNDSAKRLPGLCGCGVSDADADENGVPDCLDSKLDLCPDDSAKSLPGLCGCGASDADANRNGVPDCLDAAIDFCPDDPAKDLPGACGCGTSDADVDGNGVPDCLDGSMDLCPDDDAKKLPGVCGCGASDADADRNGIPDCLDGALDLCPDDDAKKLLGVCGCGKADTDTDSNGVPDCLDDLIVNKCGHGFAVCSDAVGEYCADLAHDANNCGGCGVVCPSGQQCAPDGTGKGACACPTATPDACGTGSNAFCTDFDSDRLNCGGCGTPCGEGQKCSPTGCVSTCGEGLSVCAAASGADFCSELTDPEHCGSCTCQCAVAKSNTATTGDLGGNAYLDQCPPGEVMIGFETSASAGYYNNTFGGFVTRCGVLSKVSTGVNTWTFQVAAGSRVPATGVRGPSYSQQTLTTLCPQDQVVIGVYGEGVRPVKMGLCCAPLTGTGADTCLQASPGTVTVQPMVGYIGGSAFGPFDCPAGTVASGSNLRAGEIINAYGLFCKSVNLIQAGR